jgi:predicted DNA-binding transcriptional regulator YafY
MAKSRSEGDRRARQIQRLGRVLKVLRLIQDRHGRWDLPSLARELGCSTKTVQRDLLALEEARIPFFYDK